MLIVYGNGSHAAGCAHYADAIQSVAPFDVFILEYPGYADRPGSPSQRSLFRAGDGAFQLLATNKPVFLLGESLGSGVAAYLAGDASRPGRRRDFAVALQPADRCRAESHAAVAGAPAARGPVSFGGLLEKLSRPGRRGTWTGATPWCRKNSAYGFTTVMPARRNFGNFQKADTLKSPNRRRNSGTKSSSSGRPTMLFHRSSASTAAG